MDRQLYEEMTRNLEKLDREQGLTGRQIFLFGHCSAAEELADMLLDRGQTPAGFLDNNGAKHGKTYRGIKSCLRRRFWPGSPRRPWSALWPGLMRP